MNNELEKKCNDLKSRLSEFIGTFGLSVNRLSTVINIETKTLNNQINSTTSVSAQVLIGILDKYNISAEWLLRGDGEMLLTENHDEPTLTEKDLRRQLAFMRALLEDKDKLLIEKDLRIADLRELLNLKKGDTPSLIQNKEVI